MSKFVVMLFETDRDTHAVVIEYSLVIAAGYLSLRTPIENVSIRGNNERNLVINCL